MLGLIDGFEWDEGNSAKCEKHGVSLNEIEAVFQGRVHLFPDLEHSQHETRYLAIGRTAAGRHLFLAFTIRQQDTTRLIRPISARYMHAKEVEHYEKQIAQSDH